MFFLRKGRPRDARQIDKEVPKTQEAMLFLRKPYVRASNECHRGVENRRQTVPDIVDLLLTLQM